MTISVCVVLDEPKAINPKADTTYGLCLEAQRRGLAVHLALINDLILKDGQAMAKTYHAECSENSPYLAMAKDKADLLPLDEFDFVLMRKDPPVDEAFQVATHLLRFCRKARVVNDPTAILLAPEKIFPYHFAHIFPPSILSSSISTIQDFLAEHEEGIIIKPLNECGGRGILHLVQGDLNNTSILELMTAEETRCITAQKYLPAVRQGDKRIICLDGEYVGSLLRIPLETDHRANLHAGGRGTYIPRLDSREQECIAQLSPTLKKNGLFFVGIDMIGGYITEINVTSPTGIREILAQGGADIASLYWQTLLNE